MSQATATVLAPAQVAGPGVYPGMPDAEYHADPVPGGSLSSTGARKLVRPSTPAHFRWWLDHPQPPRADFDLGHAAHAAVLGVGLAVSRIEHDDWRTKAAKEARDAAYADGKVPLLGRQADVVAEMASALREHRLAASLLRAELGTPELSLVWKHERTGVMCRARVDFLRNRATSGPVLVVDYKTCDDASPEAVERTIANYGYDQQGCWYEDGAQALDLADEPQFVLIFQEKNAPYLVNVVQLDHDWHSRGRLRNSDAINLYAECTRSGRWPGYGDGKNPTLSSPPRWALIQEGLA